MVEKMMKSFGLLMVMILLLMGCTDVQAPSVEVDEQEEALQQDDATTAEEVVEEDNPVEAVETEKNVASIITLEDLSEFQDHMVVMSGIRYEEEVLFMAAIESIFEGQSVFYEEEILTLEAYMETSFFDNTSFLYQADIDNNGEEDLVITYKFAGTGMFSSIDTLFLKEGSSYRQVIMGEELITNFLDLVTYDGLTYVYTSSSGVDLIYIWENEGLKQIFDESTLADNSHLDMDYTLLDQRVQETYGIETLEQDLLDSDIDFSLSTGYTNLEILTTYFKFKEFMGSGNKEALANMVEFPLEVERDGDRIKLYNKEDFLEHYDWIINEDIRSIVASSTSEEIFASWRGAMIGNGEIWFTDHIYAIY
ncbi:conserved exported protein of unknown function [Petrocella atlantisensis]|uniref:Uncharacterized protein n=1 Tax=Petrocella atlantisensis TaxID=2173034 RepID=A0A3P7NUQ4_9FIRM|nr:hypothetical protein [Petrocella atlantisensis]VDN46615.1 conserved exported protein of unknown function [Petrocella atlantisensis]